MITDVQTVVNILIIMLIHMLIPKIDNLLEDAIMDKCMDECVCMCMRIFWTPWYGPPHYEADFFHIWYRSQMSKMLAMFFNIWDKFQMLKKLSTLFNIWDRSQLLEMMSTCWSSCWSTCWFWKAITIGRRCYVRMYGWMCMYVYVYEKFLDLQCMLCMHVHLQ